MDADRPRLPSSEELRRAKREARDRLCVLDGFRGVGIGDGTVRVYVRDTTAAGALPADVDGVPVEPVVVGDVQAWDASGSVRRSR